MNLTTDKEQKIWSVWVYASLDHPHLCHGRSAIHCYILELFDMSTSVAVIW